LINVFISAKGGVEGSRAYSPPGVGWEEISAGVYSCMQLFGTVGRTSWGIWSDKAVFPVLFMLYNFRTSIGHDTDIQYACLSAERSFAGEMSTSAEQIVFFDLYARLCARELKKLWMDLDWIFVRSGHFPRRKSVDVGDGPETFAECGF